MARRREQHRHRQRHHHRQVEQDRCRRGRREARQRVEDAAIKRHQGHQRKIGKGDAGEFDREREAAGVLGKARCQQRDHRRREDECDREEDRQAREQQREHAVREQTGRRRPTLLADACIGRHEGRVESAFGEYHPEMVREPQGDEKRVGDRARTEHGGQQDIPGKAREARQQRQAADGEDASEHWSARWYVFGRGQIRDGDGRNKSATAPPSLLNSA